MGNLMYTSLFPSIGHFISHSVAHHKEKGSFYAIIIFLTYIGAFYAL